MNEWEHLKTKTPEEVADWFGKAVADMVHGQRTIVSTKNKLIDFLQSPHETTADEDFAEIGFKLTGNLFGIKTYEEEQKWHGDINARVVNVCEKYNQYITKGCLAFHDELINQIRTIADKKRKEMGWDK